MTVKQIRDFLTWLRKERITYHTITIGGVTLEGVVDGKHESKPVKVEQPDTMWERNARALMATPPTATDDVPEETLLDD